ncbi:DNA cytosine methyltransferase [Kytococcus aerolatus]|uniref:DNA cytosine methyltransferase n=1 Tax=Kytococcus aerolatus TaxID=592308 RepID=UPI001F18B37E|nr:DNA cytosine methyltransferase [Kytococcus aerolatus]
MIDVFAGPGGLNEGFASLERGAAFSVAGSFEMDTSSIETLTIRSVQRILRGKTGANHPVHEQLLRGQIDLATFRNHPDVVDAWDSAAAHVHQIELGGATRRESDSLISQALAGLSAGDPWVLIGGPPCQAYSMAGRSRRRHDEAFEQDVKHFLYREYLHIIRKFRPAVFVMENVKGMLSTQHGGQGLFQRIRDDLENPLGGELERYHLRSLTVATPVVKQPRDFVVRAENHGVPQARHRVILVGVRHDLHEKSKNAWRPLDVQFHVPTLSDVLADLPKLRSRLSPRRSDSAAAWNEIRREAFASVHRPLPEAVPPLGGAWVPASEYAEHRPAVKELMEWLRHSPEGYSQHETRSHMAPDLVRYAYLAHLAEEGDRPHVQDLPEALRPQHKNVTKKKVPFSDRFRVQRWNHPSSTVVAHLSKDGHYFIHPDPAQMRSITVREAARLQTFPDDYFFAGNRTKQYQQVGNAVPPFLARQIAQRVYELLTA